MIRSVPAIFASCCLFALLAACGPAPDTAACGDSCAADTAATFEPDNALAVWRGGVPNRQPRANPPTSHAEWDADGDGYDGEEFGGTDCDDDDPFIHPDADEVCYYEEDDPDHFEEDEDCDDQVDEGFDSNTNGAPDCQETEICDKIDNDGDGIVDEDTSDLIWYFDADGDGYGISATTTLSCSSPGSSWALQSDDCNDVDDAINPGESELCDGSNDEDCDDEVDESTAADAAEWYIDSDGDGYGDDDDVQDACAQPSGYVANNSDCDDDDPDVSPGEPEICNDIDDDCDGVDDDELPDSDSDGICDELDSEDCDGVDNDGDSAVDEDTPDTDGDGTCDELDTEVCDGVDNDGDGTVDESGDADGDGTPDCLDTEICDGDDNDGDGSVDEAFDLDEDGVIDEGGATNAVVWYRDLDEDGYGDDDTTQVACDKPSGSYTLVSGDCDDLDDDVNSGATEICDGEDNDCDGTNNEGSVEVDADSSLAPVAEDATAWYADGDGDSYGDDEEVYACDQPSSHVAVAGDCDDDDAAYNPGVTEDDCADPNDYDCDGSVAYTDGDGDGWAACEDCADDDEEVHPDAAEICNDADDDCDETADEDVDVYDWYFDYDGDGYGDPDNTQSDCAQPSGYVGDSSDCDDTDAGVHPGASEVCDGGLVDEDCDGAIDDADGSVDPATFTTFYADADGDSYGAPGATAAACAAPSGYVADSGDCDDSDADAWPGADEFCDGHDDDCDGDADEPDAIDAATWYPDADADGYGDYKSAPVTACDQPSGYIDNILDCDDGDASLNPETIWYADDDGDTWGDPAQTAQQCNTPEGYVSNDGDCDDGDGAVHPEALEICDPADTDEDCDGLADDDDVGPGGVSDAGAWYADGDGDGYGDPTTETTACDQPDGYVPVGEADCDDGDPGAHPGAAETWYDGVDADCDGASDYDADADGYDADAHGGADCDDADDAISPAAEEIPDDGLDNDCDGVSGGDSDGDGLSDAEEEALGTDPASGDSDGDGLSDGEEVDLGTDPLSTDTDGDGHDDAWEDANGLDPNTPLPDDPALPPAGRLCASGGDAPGTPLALIALAGLIRRRRC